MERGYRQAHRLWSEGLIEGLDHALESVDPLARRWGNDAAVQEVAHYPVARRPVVSVGIKVVGADVVAAKRGSCA